nr:hypothetical protein [Curtobacterium allii]
MRVVEPDADRPAAIGESAPVHVRQVRVAGIERAVRSDPRHVPAGALQLVPEECQVELGVVRNDGEPRETRDDRTGDVSETRLTDDVGLPDAVDVGCPDRSFRIDSGHPFVDDCACCVEPHDRNLEDAVPLR